MSDIVIDKRKVRADIANTIMEIFEEDLTQSINRKWLLEHTSFSVAAMCWALDTLIVDEENPT
jgi:hypothetical protein